MQLNSHWTLFAFFDGQVEFQTEIEFQLKLCGNEYPRWDPDMKVTGMLVGKLKLNPRRRETNLGMAQA